jgi:hypothetical protein
MIDSKFAMPALLSNNKLALTLLTALMPLCFILWRHNPDVAEENSLLEWLQVATLLLAFAVHTYIAFRVPLFGTNFIIRVSFAMLTVSFGLRELDVYQFGQSDILVGIEHALRYVKIGLGVTLLVFLISQSHRIWASLFAILTNRVMILSLIGCLILLATEPFDRSRFNLAADLSRFIEEALELLAYAFLLVASRQGNYHLQK